MSRLANAFKIDNTLDLAMYVLMCFDTEDFLSHPDAPVHRLPAQFADIMARYGIKGCFHLIGEKARFMARHQQYDVIEALRHHDVSLHTNRGSVHPTLSEEVSGLDWLTGVDRVMFREKPGLQSIEAVFGSCTAMSQHGGIFAAQIVYAAGRMSKPFFQNPFGRADQSVGWFCNNLIIGVWGGGAFDHAYRDTPLFDQKLAEQQAFLDQAIDRHDLVCLAGCHPVNTVMQAFPCSNFYNGASPAPEDWRAPTMYPDISIPLIMANFERRIAALADFPGLEWTTVKGIERRYSKRPVRVTDAQIITGAKAVIENGGPTFTNALSAGELLYLLARRRLAPVAIYDVPQVMGPIESVQGAEIALPAEVDPVGLCRELIERIHDSGYLPGALSASSHRLTPASVLVWLACDALGIKPGAQTASNLSVEAIPGVPEAIENVKRYRDWRVHGTLYRQENILWHFRSQCWTYKPAFEAGTYPAGVETADYLNTAFPFGYR